jgi:NSS family neurotransmitter:Na+ symporter
MDKRFGFLGWLATIVPVIIFPYYCVIGGWIVKYGFTYASGASGDIYTTGAGNFFTGFITDTWSPLLCFLIFMGAAAIIVLLGVEKGIEKASKIMMPILFVLIIGIAIYSLTLTHTDADGNTRTALDGLAIYLIPNFDGITPSKFISILLDAVGQLFYSLSVAMGIMITYGSYAKKNSDLVTSINRIEIFDTGVALLAGLIIIPTVFVFQGQEGLAASGPSLMFVSLPQVFEQMGGLGHVIGALFFILVLFAALTSSISLMETVVSIFMDKLKVGRKAACLIVIGVSIVIGVPSSLGNGIWSGVTILGMDFLTFFDFITNNVIMPVVAFITCILVGYVIKPKAIIEEVETNGKFTGKNLFTVVIKYIAPVCIVAILVFSVLEGIGVIKV